MTSTGAPCGRQVPHGLRPNRIRIRCFWRPSRRLFDTGAPEGRVAPACCLLGFSNLRARAEVAALRAIGSPHRPTSHDVPPFPAHRKWIVSLTLSFPVRRDQTAAVP